MVISIAAGIFHCIFTPFERPDTTARSVMRSSFRHIRQKQKFSGLLDIIELILLLIFVMHTSRRYSFQEYCAGF